MANQTVSVDSNHDALTGRAAGEDFTVTSGATLTIDSCPHLTSSGILGDITLSEGRLLIDGSRTFEVAYSSGTGTIPTVGTAITWNSGADSGKIIRLDSGNNVAGVLTLTKNSGSLTPDSDDAITDGSWTADLDSVKVGYLMVLGEDQDWGAVDGRSSLKITGDWYEIGIGTGADNQTIELPHTSHQPAIWVETGNGTGIFDKWFRISPNASLIFYNGVAQFGGTYESGFCFEQAYGDATITFGTSTNGGAPPSGARIRIPNVHIGTTSIAATPAEINTATIANYITIIAPNVNLAVEIDHLNATTVQVDFRGTSDASISDSCWGLHTTAAQVQKVNATVSWDNCAVVSGSPGVAGYLPVLVQEVLDNVGGVTFNDCLWYHGTNNSNTGAFYLLTCANIAFTGVCKIVSAVQDENTTATLRGAVAVNVTAETLICVGGAIIATAGCNNWTIDELVYGSPVGRGTTEQNFNMVSLSGTQNVVINSGHLGDGLRHSTNGLFLLTDSFDTTIRNFGSITNKIDGNNRCTYVASIAGITSGVLLQRLWFDNINGTQAFVMINSAADVTIENCSGEYANEIEPDANRCLIKGLHGASGNPDATTGVEGDSVNVIGSIFLDYFKSDTTGALGLTFTDRGQKHLADVEFVSGTPLFNGLGDLLMRTAGDQVIFTWPYTIKGHTGFQNAAVQLSGVNTANLSYEYSIDTGSGWTAWAAANGTNMSADTISPAGFKFRLRLTCTTGATTNAIKGFAALTTTTLADQAANFYPLAVNTLTLTGLANPTEVRVFEAGTTIEVAGIENATSGTFSTQIDGGEFPLLDISILSLGYINTRLTGIDISSGDVAIPVQQVVDRQYANV